MRAMILAAGRGNRMRPLTDSVPKPLLKINGQHLLEYHIKALASAGVKYIVINLAYLGSQIEAAIGSGDKYGVQIEYSNEGEALETGGGIYKALPLLGDEPFLVVNGDVWSDFNFDNIVKRSVELVHLVLVPNPRQHPNGDFTLDNDKVINKKGEGASTFSGIGVYHPQLFSACSSGKFPLAPLLISAMDQGRASGEIFTGQWHDIGTPERLAALNADLAT